MSESLCAHCNEYFDMSPITAIYNHNFCSDNCMKKRELEIKLVKEKDEIMKEHRKHNIGASNYATKKIQPWDIWKEYDLDPWRADIVKRVLRTKEGADEREELEKIKHICDELISQLEPKFKTESLFDGEDLTDEQSEHEWTDEEKAMLDSMRVGEVKHVKEAYGNLCQCPQCVYERMQKTTIPKTRTEEELEVMLTIREAKDGAVVDMRNISIERFLEMSREDESHA